MKITKKSIILCILALIFLVGASWAFLILRATKSISQLKSDDWQVREQAMKTLSKTSRPAIEPLITALKHNDANVRWRTAYSLGEIGNSCAIEPLVDVLKDEDSRVRYRAVEALGKIGGSQVIEPLISALKDKNIDVQKKAVYTLIETGKPSIGPLITALGNEKDNYIREEIIKILGKIYSKKDTHIVEALIDVVLNDEYCCTLNKAIRMLDWIQWGAGSKNEKITQLIEERGWDVCPKIGELAIEPLIDKLHDGNKDIQKKAASALTKITGENFGTNFYRWRMWWEQKKEREKDKWGVTNPRPCKSCK